MFAFADKVSLGIPEGQTVYKIVHQILLPMSKEDASAIMDFNLLQIIKIVSQQSCALQIVLWVP